MGEELQLDHAVRQIVSKAIAAEGMVDIFAAVGLKSPDLSILSEEFLAEVSHLPQKNRISSVAPALSSIASA